MAEKRITYFVVQPFKKEAGRRRGLTAEQPLQVPTADAAIRKAKRYAAAGGGAVAFSRSGDPAYGDWDEAVVIGHFGEVPPDFDGASA